MTPGAEVAALGHDIIRKDDYVMIFQEDHKIT